MLVSGRASGAGYRSATLFRTLDYAGDGTQALRYTFLVGAPLQQEALHDQLETSDGIWIQPSEALARNTEGTFPLAFPTIHQLRELASYRDCTTAFASAEQRTVATIMPIRIERDGKVNFMLPPV